MPDGRELLATDCLTCRMARTHREFIRESLELAARLSPLHSLVTLDGFVADMPHRERGKAAASAFIEQMQRGLPSALVLWSNGYGTGKTHLASAIANTVRADNWRIESLLMPAFLSKIRSSYNQDSDHDEYDVLNMASGADLLVMDDVGREHVVQESWYEEKIFQLINARYQRGPLIVTTNKGITELPDWIGGAAFSRLWEMTGQGQRVVDMCGPDWRFQQ